jgi:hypothetical protein
MQPVTLPAIAIMLVMTTAAAPAFADLAERFSAHDPDSTITLDHRDYGRFLETYLRPGEDGINRFAYGEVTPQDHALLRDYIRRLESVEVASLNRDEQFAYWANLYNAVTLDVVLEHYPVDTIREIRSGFFRAGPWRLDLVTVGGVALSLDNIEHDIMRPIFRDPRVHYAVNCASIGCPNLWSEPFTGESLEAQLEHGADAYINHPRGARVENGRLRVSSIYHWYTEDFGGNDAGVIAHLKKYAGDELRAALRDMTRISGHDYDWALNEPGR